MGGETKLSGPDLAAGISESEVPADGPLLGQANGESVLLVRNGEEIFAVGATCTHYSGPLGEGLVVDGTMRCPWHHACFDLRTGAALRAPALNPLPCYEVERVGRQGPRRRPAWRSDQLRRESSLRTIAIVGAGRRASRRRRRCGARDTTARSCCSAPRSRPRRSPEPVEGLPGRNGARRVDAAAAAVVLRRAEDRAHARRPRDGDRSGRQAALARRTAARSPGTRCCWPPAPRRSARRCRAPSCRTSTRCARSPTAAPSSRARAAPSARSWSAPASSASRWRRRCGRAI